MATDRGQGRNYKKKPNLEEMIGAEWDKVPGELERKFAAIGLGIQEDEVPDFDTVAELQVWVFRMFALRGSKDHWTELGDRAAPKPSRLKELNQSNSTRTRKAGVPLEEDKWFGNLDANNTPPPEEDDEDIM